VHRDQPMACRGSGKRRPKKPRNSVFSRACADECDSMIRQFLKERTNGC
jgi:hypothetical protein